MRKFYSADFHFGGLSNGTDTAMMLNRPFKNTERMENAIIRNVQARLKKEDSDVLIHVGDFMFKGRKEQNISSSFKDYLNRLDRDVICLKGNHDDNNGVKCLGNSLITDIGKYKDVLVTHYPVYHDNDKDIRKYKSFTAFKFKNKLYPVDIVLCGHVHNLFKSLMYIGKNRIVLNINVGVDVWKKFCPVSESELENYIDAILNGKIKVDKIRERRRERRNETKKD